jgi:dTDP-4-amino-4,6-dideoxygalactose transaminase
MHEQGVHATFHYVPLHLSPAGRRFAAREVACPVTTAISERLLRLPFYTDMTEAELERAVEVFVTALDT